MEIEKYLTNKRAQLDGPGVLHNDLYYSVMNSTTSLIETTYMSSKNFQSLPSLQFNSSSTINIQNENFIGDVYVHLELPAIVADQTLCRGWGYSCIQEITYLMGASSSTFTIGGQALLAMLVSQANEQVAKNELIRLGGEEHLVPTSGPVTADVFLPLPWSSFCCDRLPFPSDLLSSNIQVTVKFKSSASIYGGIGARPTAFNQAILSYREGVLSDKGLSLRYDLMANPELHYSYPFVYARQFERRFNGNVNGTSIQLDGFLNGDLLGIAFYVVKESDVNPSASLHPKPLNADPITDVELLYNGNYMYRSFGQSWKLENMSPGKCPNYFHNSIVTSGSNTGPFNSVPVDTYINNIDFTRTRAACQPSNMFNSLRVANQVLDLRFRTSSDEQYILYAVYMYNGIIQCQAGVSEVFMD